MLEEKKYKVKIVGSFTGQSAEKKTPFIGLELETECGNYIDWIAYITENTDERNFKTLLEAGFKGKKIADLSNDKLDMDDLFTPIPTLTATVEHEEYENKEGETKTRAVVKWLNTGNFGPAKAGHKEAQQIFANTKFDSVFTSMRSNFKSPKTEKATTEPERTYEADFSADDIPF